MRQRFVVKLDVELPERYEPSDMALVLDCMLDKPPDWDVRDFNGDEGVLVHELVRAKEARP